MKLKHADNEIKRMEIVYNDKSNEFDQLHTAYKELTKQNNETKAKLEISKKIVDHHTPFLFYHKHNYHHFLPFKLQPLVVITNTQTIYLTCSLS